MPTDIQLLEERNEYVNEVYKVLSRKGHAPDGKRYTHSVICRDMKKEYKVFLTPRTILAIISGEYDRKKKTA